MPSVILKCNRGEDIYVIWSTVTESPHFVGDRTELIERLITEPSAEPIGDRIARADATGSSALWPTTGTPFGGWGKSLIYQQQGWLHRDQLCNLARRLRDHGENIDVSDLLEPFEDEGA